MVQERFREEAKYLVMQGSYFIGNDEPLVKQFPNELLLFMRGVLSLGEQLQKGILQKGFSRELLNSIESNEKSWISSVSTNVASLFDLAYEKVPAMAASCSEASEALTANIVTDESLMRNLRIIQSYTKFFRQSEEVKQLARHSSAAHWLSESLTDEALKVSALLENPEVTFSQVAKSLTKLGEALGHNLSELRHEQLSVEARVATFRANLIGIRERLQEIDEKTMAVVAV